MNKREVLFVAMLAMIFGIMVGEHTKGGFFRPWYDDGRIYVRDRVKYVRGTFDPDNCEYGIVLDLIDDTALVGYQECWNDADGPQYKGSFLKLIGTKALKKETK